MDVPQIRKHTPTLMKHLKRFDACFPRKNTIAFRPIDVFSQLSDLAEKSVEPIAINTGVSVRPLQERLSQHCWD